MRLAFITYEYPPDTGKGGIGTYTKQVADVLGRQGWDVHVFAGSHHRQCENYENNIHIHWVRCDSPHDFRLKVLPVFQSEHSGKAFELMESPEIHGNAWEIKKAFPQVPLIVRFHAANWLVERLKKKYSSFTSRLRFVLGALLRGRWDLGYWRKYDYRNDPDYQFCLLADAMAAPSEAMIKWVAHNWKLRVPGIKLIPNLFVAPGALLQLPVPEKAIYKKIVFFGRLNVLKGLVNATLAMKIILKEFRDYKFSVIGDDGRGPYNHPSMRAWMKAQLTDVTERVSFLDGLPYDQLPNAIADAEIILLPSLFESFSYTCAEAMAGGKAVIASSKTGMAEMLQHRETGVLVDAENITAIAEGIRLLILDNELRYTISENARNSITTKYNNHQLKEQYIYFYKSVVNTG